jgi:ferredoxin-NADP reductase
LYYPAETPDAPLWLIASGSGLAPLWGILREALRQQHSGPIHVVHRARTKEGHYLQLSLDVLATEHANLSIDYLDDETWAAWLKALRLPSRQTVALACGGTVFIEELSRQMFMAGLPRRQLLTDTYFSRSG